MSNQKTVGTVLPFALLLGALILLVTASSAIAQVEPQQGAINTTRSNIKNTSRVIPPGGLPITGVWVELINESSPAVGARITQTDEKGAFNFAGVSPGEYVLIFSAAKPQADRKIGDLTGQLADLKGDLSARTGGSLNDKIDSEIAKISISGAAGGPIQKEWAIKVKEELAGDRNSATSARIEQVRSELSGRTKRPGASNFTHITLRVEAGAAKDLRGQVSLIK